MVTTHTITDERLAELIEMHDRKHYESAPWRPIVTEWMVIWKSIHAALLELQQLRDLFPCGHRKIDWDNSYGSCVACTYIHLVNDCEMERYDEMVLELQQRRAGDAKAVPEPD